MPTLRLTCFHHLQIEQDGQIINRFDTDKARALLVYLAVENSRPHNRSHLAGLLWSDQSEEQALHSLRQTISSLRKTLGDASSSNPVLQIERDLVQLNPARAVWVDVHAFRSGLAELNSSRPPGQGRWLNVRKLAKALKIRRGSFLAHFDLKGDLLFNEWQLLVREELDQLAVEGLGLLAQVYERRGEFHQARLAAQQIIELSPWDEAAHLQLMRLLVLDGQPGAALNQFRLLRRTLQEELGIEPAGETVALFEKIRSTGGQAGVISLSRPAEPSNLPLSSTTFVGREQEMDEVASLLAKPDCRLVTLFGPGGVGKTRLALEAARQQMGAVADGVFYVPLAGASSSHQTYTSIAAALRLVLAEQGDPQARVIDYLHHKQLLLVLDNYEQLLAAPDGTLPLVEILGNAAGVKLLVTSRVRLMLQEEWVYPVSGLGVPAANRLISLQSAADYDALELFQRRACQVEPAFAFTPASLPAVIQICQMLEGLPLGVELAAAQVWAQPCSALAESISTRLNSLSTYASNADPRHRSLWTVFEVSWQGLSPGEQETFCQLAIFPGSFEADAARQVSGAEAAQLTQLVNRSLLILEPGGSYRMHEAIRQFGREKLAASGLLPGMQARHARFFVSFLAGQKPLLQGSEQKQSLAVIQSQIGNCRQAWQWLIENRQWEGVAASLESLYHFFNIRSRFSEGIDLFLPAIALLKANPTPCDEPLLGRLLARVGSLAYYARQNTLALETLEQAQEIFLQHDIPQELAFARISLGGMYLRSKDFEKALACAQQNLAYFQQAGDALGETRALYLHGLIQNRLGKIQESRRLLLEAVRVGKQTDDRRRLMAPLNLLGDIACSEGNYAEAEALFCESLALARDLEDLYYQAILLNNLASVYLLNQQYPAANNTFEESLRICREIGDLDGESLALNNLGELAVVQGEFERAIAYSNQALQIALEIEEDWTIIVCQNNLGEAYLGLGQYDLALNYLMQAIRTAWERQAYDQLPRFVINAGRCCQLQNKTDQAREFYQAALAHSATEHEMRKRADRWLAEINVPGEVEPDDKRLEELVRRWID